MIKRYKIVEYVLTAILMLALLCIVKTAFGKPAKSDVVAGIDPHRAAAILEQLEKLEQEKRDIDLMAHLIYAENGDDSYSEYMKAMEYTGSVVLNRVASERYPDTLEGVIYQRGQYACTWDGGIEKEPSADAFEVASKLIKDGSKLPAGVLGAAEFKQGRVYDYVAGTYYCYLE